MSTGEEAAICGSGIHRRDTVIFLSIKKSGTAANSRLFKRPGVYLFLGGGEIIFRKVV